MEDPIPEKRPSIVQFYRQFSALETWMARTAWLYRVFRPVFACVIIAFDRVVLVLTGVHVSDALGSFGWNVVSLFVR